MNLAHKNMEICWKMFCNAEGFAVCVYMSVCVSVCLSVTFRQGDTQVLGLPLTICFVPPAETPTTQTCQKSDILYAVVFITHKLRDENESKHLFQNIHEEVPYVSFYTKIYPKQIKD